MAEELKPGDDAPTFILPSSDGGEADLTSYRGKTVVLYFYPKDDTPGCTKEACAFRDSFAALKKAKAVVLGVSLDPLPSHQKFIQKYTLPFPLLSDADAAVSKAYGVYKLKSLYGRQFWGIERSTFIIDPKGKISHLFRRVKVDSHVEEILSALKKPATVRKR
ncbi:MAG: thioredoxin-dependent thiol peroxidase [Candidatus Manganitrophaceae bacterium]|nr:MAG: thioredoxin-dependent thiol peroxidase [Candidatus Manganitrophaceae bacterium]